MKVLLDTCVVLDFLQKREPFCFDAKKIMQAAAEGVISGYITAKSVTDIYYLTHRCTHSDKESRSAIGKLLSIVDLLDSSAFDVRHALCSEISDFEDAVMAETAVRSQMECIVTRNKHDFEKSFVKAYTPKELLEKIPMPET